jgi:starch phosphorylase
MKQFATIKHGECGCYNFPFIPKDYHMEIINQELPRRFNLPKRISRLDELAYNLWWVWNPQAQRVFMQIDEPLWHRVNHNPVAFLSRVDRNRINFQLKNDRFLTHYDETFRAFDEYMKDGRRWAVEKHPELQKQLVAYFSFEFGLHESLPVYAGGLGVLAADHLKEASDLGLPLVAVGFIYNQGYFEQHITEDGWQETHNLLLDFNEMPVIPVKDGQGNLVKVSVELSERMVKAQIWKVQVGRIALFLLNSNLAENNPGDRDLTARLYTSDPNVRISQEILLGVGGVKALKMLGYSPTTWHMNEGHSAFLTLERLRERIEAGDSFEGAIEKVRNTNIFTSHTPVPAGNDTFPAWLIEKYFRNIWTEMKITRDQFINLGRQNQPWGEAFSMPVLALHLSKGNNAVSKLHGEVARHMWQFLYPGKKEKDVPILSITNGVHTGTWLARRMRLLYEKYLGRNWWHNLDDPRVWAQVEKIPAEEFWAVRQHLRRKLMLFTLERSRRLWLTTSVHPVQIIAGGALMNPYILTIGFARRFATYKRGNLLLHDRERLLKIINNPYMPVQIIFAGKAHPADEPGKLIIQEVYRAVKDANMGGRLIFIENYDMNIARFLVQGVDVWLNTPRIPNEASGTSGMKAALNGGINFSILDGWWAEGYNGHNGWAIGSKTSLDDPNAQDAADAESMYDTLEKEIIPLFYKRSLEGVPVEWIAKAKESVRNLAPRFCTQRMLKEYIDRLYLPAMRSNSK